MEGPSGEKSIWSECSLKNTSVSDYLFAGVRDGFLINIGLNAVSKKDSRLVVTPGGLFSLQINTDYIFSYPAVIALRGW
jgi:hypothetical protein